MKVPEPIFLILNPISESYGEDEIVNGCHWYRDISGIFIKAYYPISWLKHLDILISDILLVLSIAIKFT